MQAAIMEEIIARQSPEAQAIIRLLLAEIAKLEARIKELEPAANSIATPSPF
jgi:hypothetical protein